jgi:hypothetical protein
MLAHVRANELVVDSGIVAEQFIVGKLRVEG